MLVAGHRGYPEKYPENTLISFMSAIDTGVDMIELDIQMTLDNELIIMHNKDVDKTTNGTGLVKDMTLAEIRSLDAGSWFGKRFLGEKVPLFTEFLELTKNRKELLFDFELKEYPVPGNEERAYRTADMATALAEEYDLADRLVFNAFSADLLQYIHEKYEGRYALHGYYPSNLLGESSRDPYSFLHCACVCGELAPAPFEMLRSRNIEPWVGTSVNTEEKIRQAREYGAALITCDNPAEILGILRRLGLHS